MSHAQVMERFSVLLTRSEHSYVTTLGFAEQPPHNRRILEGFVRLDDKMFQYIHKHVKADAVRAGPPAILNAWKQKHNQPASDKSCLQRFMS